MDTYVWYGNKRIKAFFQASVAETLRGATRISAAIDELGMFNIVNTKGGSNYKHANAEETYTSLMNSLRTTRQRADELWESGDYNPLPGYFLKKVNEIREKLRFI
jgi:predicted transcriptional regulator